MFITLRCRLRQVVCARQSHCAVVLTLNSYLCQYHRPRRPLAVTFLHRPTEEELQILRGAEVLHLVQDQGQVDHESVQGHDWIEGHRS